MRTILVGDCASERLFQLTDPDAPSETQFEVDVAKVLSCIYANHVCFLFGGTFEYENTRHCADLALVAKDCSHWFIVEVELVSHSFQRHVLPQVRAFRYGSPQSDCISILAREMKIGRMRAQTLLNYVPRAVVVVANKYNREWEVALGALDIQFLAVSKFKSSAGTGAIEMHGGLSVAVKHLGFGRYSSVDRSLIMQPETDLPLGSIQIGTREGAVATWIVSRDGRVTWVTKEVGTPDIPDGAYVQLVRSIEGRIFFPSY